MGTSLKVRERFEKWRSTVQDVLFTPEEFYRGLDVETAYRESALFLISTQALVLALGVATLSAVMMASIPSEVPRLLLYVPLLTGLYIGPVFLTTLAATLILAGLGQLVYRSIDGQGSISDNFAVIAYSQAASVLYLPLMAMSLGGINPGFGSTVLLSFVFIGAVIITMYMVYIQVIGTAIVQHISRWKAAAPYIGLVFLYIGIIVIYALSDYIFGLLGALV